MPLPPYTRKKPCTNNKRKYAVYMCMEGIGVYHNNKIRQYVGETYAVSEKQAINNVRYRTEGKTTNFYSVGDYAGEGEHFYFYEAEEI